MHGSRLAAADDARQAAAVVERQARLVLVATDQLTPAEVEAWRDIARHATGLKRAALRVIDRLVPVKG